MSLDTQRDIRDFTHHEAFEAERVIYELVRSAQERARGEKPTARPCIAILPGGLDGVSGGYGMAKLEHMRLTQGFHAILGSSTGAAAAAYGAAEKAGIGCTIYPDECTRTQFFDLKRRKEGKPIMDVHWLVHTVFAGKLQGSEHKKLNASRVINSEIETYFQVKNSKTGESELRRPQTETELMQTLEASMSFPIMTNYVPVLIDGVQYEDAGDTNPFPYEDFSKIARPTSMIVFTNRSKKYPPSDVLQEQLAILQESGVPYIIIWADEIDKMKKTPDKLRTAGEHFAAHVASLFDKPLR